MSGELLRAMMVRVASLVSVVRMSSTVVGCVVAILVGLLFWPRSSHGEPKLADGQVHRSLQSQLLHCSD